jgi:hypothetical protein
MITPRIAAALLLILMASPATADLTAEAEQTVMSSPEVYNYVTAWMTGVRLRQPPKHRSRRARQSPYIVLNPKQGRDLLEYFRSRDIVFKSWSVLSGSSVFLTLTGYKGTTEFSYQYGFQELKAPGSDPAEEGIYELSSAQKKLGWTGDPGSGTSLGSEYFPLAQAPFPADATSVRRAGCWLGTHPIELDAEKKYSANIHFGSRSLTVGHNMQAEYAWKDATIDFDAGCAGERKACFDAVIRLEHLIDTLEEYRPKAPSNGADAAWRTISCARSLVAAFRKYAGLYY